MQPLPQDYFSCFGLPQRLGLDLAELDRKRLDLSRQYHPDRYASRPAAEQEQALQATALLNDAYRTLKDPITRAEYMLRQHGLEVADQRSKDVPPELLEEVFELNMALEEMRSGDASARPQLEEAQAKFSGMLQTVDTDLHAEFSQFDLGDAGALPRIRNLLNRRRYVRNLVQQVDQTLS